MELLKLEKVHDGKYLKNYELTYLNKEGKEKKYEMVSRKEIASKEQLGARPSGVSIVAFQDDKIMLLKEFRMSINKSIYNLCAGMLEKGETLEQCIERELYEETGLKVKKVIKILPPSFAAVGFSDTTRKTGSESFVGCPPAGSASIQSTALSTVHDEGAETAKERVAPFASTTSNSEGVMLKDRADSNTSHAHTIVTQSNNESSLKSFITFCFSRMIQI